MSRSYASGLRRDPGKTSYVTLLKGSKPPPSSPSDSKLPDPKWKDTASSVPVLHPASPSSSLLQAVETATPTDVGNSENEDCAKLLVNIKLLKESLRTTSAIGDEEFLRELEIEVHSSRAASVEGGDGGGSGKNKNATMALDGAEDDRNSLRFAFRESTWLVKRAISELHVNQNRRTTQTNSFNRGEPAVSGGAAATAAEFSLAGQVTDIRAQLATEKRSRRVAEKQAAAAGAALAEAQAAHGASSAAAAEAAQATAQALEAALEEATSLARREGEVACERLADRLHKTEGRAAAAEGQLARLQQQQHLLSPLGSQGVADNRSDGCGRAGRNGGGSGGGGSGDGAEGWPGPQSGERRENNDAYNDTSNSGGGGGGGGGMKWSAQPPVGAAGTGVGAGALGGKDRRLVALEKQVNGMRRKEAELTSSNIALESRVERLTKEIKGCRPAGPGSKARMEELTRRAKDSEALVLTTDKELAEARAMHSELAAEVASLSVARAERDGALVKLREDLAALRHTHDKATQRHAEAAAAHEASNASLLRQSEELQALAASLELKCAAVAEEGLLRLEVEAKALEGKHSLELSAEVARVQAEALKSKAAAVAEAKAACEAEAASVLQQELGAAVKATASRVQAEAELAAECAALSAQESLAAALRGVEEEHAGQLAKARAHCERLSVESRELNEAKGHLEARTALLTSKLKEATNARLDLQVWLHEGSVAATEASVLVSSLQRDNRVLQQASVATAQELVDLRDRLAVMRQLERQVEVLLAEKQEASLTATQLEEAAFHKLVEQKEALEAQATSAQATLVEEKASQQALRAQLEEVHKALVLAEATGCATTTEAAAAATTRNAEALKRAQEAAEALKRAQDAAAAAEAELVLVKAAAAAAAASAAAQEEGEKPAEVVVALRAENGLLRSRNESLRLALESLDGGGVEEGHREEEGRRTAHSRGDGGEGEGFVEVDEGDGCEEVRSSSASMLLFSAAAGGGEGPTTRTKAPATRGESGLAKLALSSDDAQEELRAARGKIAKLEQDKRSNSETVAVARAQLASLEKVAASFGSPHSPFSSPYSSPYSLPSPTKPLPSSSSSSPASPSAAASSSLATAHPSEHRAAAAVAALSKARASAAQHKTLAERRISALEEELSSTQRREKDASKQLLTARKNLSRRQQQQATSSGVVSAAEGNVINSNSNTVAAAAAAAVNVFNGIVDAGEGGVGGQGSGEGAADEKTTTRSSPGSRSSVSSGRSSHKRLLVAGSPPTCPPPYATHDHVTAEDDGGDANVNSSKMRKRGNGGGRGSDDGTASNRSSGSSSRGSTITPTHEGTALPPNDDPGTAAAAAAAAAKKVTASTVRSASTATSDDGDDGDSSGVDTQAGDVVVGDDDDADVDGGGPKTSKMLASEWLAKRNQASLSLSYSSYSSLAAAAATVSTTSSKLLNPTLTKVGDLTFGSTAASDTYNIAIPPDGSGATATRDDTIASERDEATASSSGSGTSSSSSSGSSGSSGSSASGSSSSGEVEELRRALEVQQRQIESLLTGQSQHSTSSPSITKSETVAVTSLAPPSIPHHSPRPSSISDNNDTSTPPMQPASNASLTTPPPLSVATPPPPATFPSPGSPLVRIPRSPDTPVYISSGGGGGGGGDGSSSSSGGGNSSGSGYGSLHPTGGAGNAGSVGGGYGSSNHDALLWQAAVLPGSASAAACELVWRGVAETCLLKPLGGGAAAHSSRGRHGASSSSIQQYNRRGVRTLMRLFSTEFDRSKTARNTSSQFSQGLARIGVKRTSAEVAHAFKDMLQARKKMHKQRQQQHSSSPVAWPVASTTASSGGGMVDTTVGAEDFVEAAQRWLNGVLEDDDWAALFGGNATTQQLPPHPPSSELDPLPPTSTPLSTHATPPPLPSYSSSSLASSSSIHQRHRTPSPRNATQYLQRRNSSPSPRAPPATSTPAASPAYSPPPPPRPVRSPSPSSFRHSMPAEAVAGPSAASSGGGGGGGEDILNALSEECTFKPSLASSSKSFRANPFSAAASSTTTATTRRSTTGLSSSSSSSNQQRNASPTVGLRRSLGGSTEGSGGSSNRRLSAPASTSASLKTPTSARKGHPPSSSSAASDKKSRRSSSRPASSGDSGVFDLSEALGSVVGQASLKQQLLAFEKGIELQARRKELGIECDAQLPPHMMFCGNPGTGKTTIARLVGLVLKKLGVLKRGHLVEVQRSDLVAGAIGQTALKTRERLKEAAGGVLFVDEAYTLAPGGGAETKDFGREAINEVMSVMQDGDPVVIFAGYALEMDSFVRANAGLFRRIDVRYDFANYSCAELATILRHEVEGGGFLLCPDTVDTEGPASNVASLLEAETSPELRAATNGGLARQLFRRARGKLDEGLSLDASPEEMCTLTLRHLESALKDIAAAAPPPQRPPPSTNPPPNAAATAAAAAAAAAAGAVTATAGRGGFKSGPSPAV